MKKYITILFLLCNTLYTFSNTNLYQGDLTFVPGNRNMTVEMKVVSFPFEGVTNSNQANYGRYDSLFCIGSSENGIFKI